MNFSVCLMENHTVRERIEYMLSSERFPGSAIFAGPEESGKNETAARVARFLNCLQPQKNRGEACGHCISCRKIDPRGEIKHLDVLVIRPEGRWFKVDQVRGVRREIYFRPFEGKKRVFILDRADRMTIESANALLKVLEEPPAHAHLILLCSSFLALLPTIRSRCLLFRFGAMPKDKIVSSLQERHNLDSSRASVVASLVRANRLHLSEFNWDDFSLVRDKILTLLHIALIKKDPVALLDYLDFTSQKRDELDDLTKTLITILRDVLALRCGTEIDFILHHDISDKLGAFSDGLHKEDISMFLEKALRMENNFNRNVNKKLAFETLFLSYYRHRRDKEAGNQ